ncbi:MAG TPA: triose-phosphate isomerase [Euryarchaeota archaeon]|nr:triose-phosphate isomerase [Euryarchaeota archaeon]
MKIKMPVIMVNVKAYSESMGDKDIALARACEEVKEELGVSIAYAPQMVDLALVVREVNIPVLAQHAEAFLPGSKTGYTVLEAVNEAGASGTLINHSEHRLELADIDFLVSEARKLDLYTVVCTNNIPVSMAAAELSPNCIAIEPPDLIGSGIPVSKAEPEIVKMSVEAVKDINKDIAVLCGAGISTGKDVKAALELGAEGVLLASGVVKAENPKEVLLDLANGT